MRRASIPATLLPETPLTGSALALPEDTLHYLRNVLRLGPGERVELFDGTGRLLVVELGEDALVQVLTDEQSEGRESPLEITLYQAIPKGDRWEWLLEKACEAGVSSIVPLQTARSVVKIAPNKADKKLTRWRRILESASRQCLRARVPDLLAPQRLSEVLAAAPNADLRLVASTLSAPTLRSFEAPTSVDIFIGPEGGWTDDELATLARHDVLPFSMGPRVFRSETAGLAATLLAGTLWGDLARGHAPTTTPYDEP